MIAWSFLYISHLSNLNSKQINLTTEQLPGANKTNYNGIEISTDVNNDINDGLVVIVGVGDELQESIYMASNIRRKQASWTTDWL